MRSSLTSGEEQHGHERTVLGFESFQKRAKRQDITEGVEKPQVDEGIRVETIHCEHRAVVSIDDKQERHT